MTTEILSLAKYLASSRSEFSLSEMNEYLSVKHKEKDLYAILKPHFFDLGLFCDSRYKCQKLKPSPLPVNDNIIRELEAYFKTPRLPSGIENLIESYIEREMGKNWHTGVPAQLIRENIVKQKEEYWKGSKDSKYPGIRVISYLLYHFPVYFTQFQFVLLDLLKSGMLTTRMSFLDAGSGPGTVTLSTIDFLKKLLEIYSKNNIDVKINVRIDAIEEAQENIDTYKELTSIYLSERVQGKANIIINEPLHSKLEKTTVPEDRDFIVFSNVLAELRAQPVERANVVEKIASKSKNPTIIIIEPADLDNSKALRVTQHALMKKGFTVFSPCSFIWGTGCRGDNCWSFQDMGNIQAPGFMKRIASTQEPYRYMNTDMKFSSVILRKDGLTKQTYQAKGKFMALSNLRKHIGKRVNVAASVMSGNLGNEKTYVFKICDGSTSIPCYAVIPSYHISDSNKELLETGYGGIIEIFGTLVRENKEFTSINLLINRNTAIRIANYIERKP